MNKKAFSFRHTLLILMGFSTLIPGLFVGLPLGNQLIESHRLSVEQALSSVANNVANGLQHQVALMSAKFQTLANDNDLISGGKSHLFLTRVERRLEQFMSSNALPTAVFYYDARKQLRTAIPVGMDFLSEVPFGDMIRPYYQNAGNAKRLKSRLHIIKNASFLKEHYLFLEQLNGETRGRVESDYFLAQTAPVYDWNGQLTSLLITVIPFEQFYTDIEDKISTSQQFKIHYMNDTVIGTTGFLYAKEDTTESKTIRLPLAASETTLHLEIKEPLSVRLSPYYDTIISVVVVLFVSTLASVILALLVANILLRPIRSLSNYVGALGRASYLTPKPVVSYLEFSRFVDLLEDMGKKIELHVEKIKTQTERENELHKLQLEAELSALSFQMNPHFLFNALNSLVATATSDPELTQKMLIELANLYQRILKAFRDTSIALSEELEIVQSYIKIQQLRFGQRLRFYLDVEKDYLSDIRLPGLIVQTIVENAVKHGIEKSRSGGEIRIQVMCVNDPVYRVVIENTGALNSDETEKNTGGTGIENTKKRLKATVGNDYFFKIRANKSETRTIVEFNIKRRVNCE